MTAVREERRLVTSMFVDLVGSTELTMRLGAERLKAELDRAFGEISRIITDHGGTVEKYIGDAIYALFGAPVAHEDDPLRALRAAEAIRAYCMHGQGHGHAFTVRVGIETGEAIIDLGAATTTRQQMSVGAVVNIAARLQQRAEPGEILVGPTARQATASTAEFDDLGEAELRGVGGLRIARLVRVGASRVSALPFVGRDAELALLGHALQRARKGRSVLAVVSGPPGQGKTRLVQEFLRHAAGDVHVIATRCRPADEVGVFAPMRDILGVTTLDELATQVGRLCRDDTECERVVAGLAESAGIATSGSLSALGADERQDEIVQAWRRYLGLVGGDSLVILAVDDIHWADASLVRLVDRITFNGPRVLVVATARPEFADAAGVRPSGDRFFIELEGLEADEAQQLARLAGRPNESVVQRAEGNPLFIVELARATTDTGDLPVTLQGALGARLDQLDASDRALISLAAVAGERFTAADAAFLAGRDVTDAARDLGRMVDLHFLDVADREYRFHHGLVRDVAYGRLLAAERMRAHARFAQERVNPEHAAALAYHWWEALKPPDAEWVWASDARLPEMRREAYHAHLAAGRAHADHFAVDRAAELLARALSFATDDAERAGAEHALGNAYTRVLRQDDSWEHLRSAFDLYRAAGAVPLDLYTDLLRSAQWIGAFQRQPAEDDIVRIAEEGAARARAASDVRALANILRAHAQYLLNKYDSQPERARPIIDEALEAAAASGDVAARRGVLFTMAQALRRLGRWEEAERYSSEAFTLLAGADALERMNAMRLRGWLEFHRGDLTTAETTARESMAAAEPMGPHNRTHAWSDLAELLRATGRWDELIELAHRAAKIINEAKGTAFCDAAATILRDGAIAHALRGEREEATTLLRAMPTNDIDVELMSALPQALLGFHSAQADAKLASGSWGWWEWEGAAFRDVVLRRAAEAELAIERMGPAATGSQVLRAFAEGVREAAAEVRGGPPARYEALHRLGLKGSIEILKRRVDAEY